MNWSLYKTSLCVGIKYPFSVEPHETADIKDVVNKSGSTVNINNCLSFSKKILIHHSEFYLYSLPFLAYHRPKILEIL